MAFAAAYLVGVIIGTVLHGYKTTRAILDPLFATYYAIPVFAFYPLFIVIFGLGDGPQVLIGFMLGHRRRDHHHAQRPRSRADGAEENGTD